MAEQQPMTTEERLLYLEGQLGAVKTVCAATINKLALDDTARQTLRRFFRTLVLAVNHDAPPIFRRGAADFLDELSGLIGEDES